MLTIERDSLIGEYKLYLDANSPLFSRQVEFTQEFALDSKSNERKNAKISCSLCWIYSRVRLLNDYFEEMKETLEKVEAEKEKYQEFFNLLYHPTFIAPNSKTEPDTVKQKIDKYISDKADAIATAMSTGRVDWIRISINASLVYLMLTVAAMFYRTDYINVSILSAYTLCNILRLISTAYRFILQIFSIFHNACHSLTYI
jgi:hypothetical protein